MVQLCGVAHLVVWVGKCVKVGESVFGVVWEGRRLKPSRTDG